MQRLQVVERLPKHAAKKAEQRFQFRNNMLPKKKRITKDIFQTILKKGNIVSGSFFLFRYIKGSYPQYVFVVSKKITKTAIKRNSLRRRGYNILRQYNLKNCAGIFFYKKEAINIPVNELKKDIEFILEKIKLI